MGMFSHDEFDGCSQEPAPALERCEHGKLRGFLFGEPCQECADAIPLQKTERQRIELLERGLLLLFRKVHVPLGAKPLTEADVAELDEILAALKAIGT